MKLSLWMALASMPVAVFAQTDSGVVTSADAEKLAALTEKVDNLEAAHKSGEEAFAEVKTTVDKLSKIKVGGYIQAQWQFADSMGQASKDGGNFASQSQERFTLRRARLKTTYKGSMSKYVLEFDASPTGLSIKDANATITEPWLKAFSFEAGIMDRPFGFEIGYSSSAIEVPERTRASQTLFPDEKDLGVAVAFKGTEQMGALEMFNFKAGAYTGMGPKANENDNEKDYIGRAGFEIPFYDINLSVDGGFSAYIGKVTNLTTKAYETAKNPSVLGWKPVSGVKKLDTFDRNLMGVDAQVYYDIPVIGGISLRGEYWWGAFPTTAKKTDVYTGDTNGVYKRNVASWYVMAVQNIGLKNQLALRYDVFDPNTDAEGGDIGKAGSNLDVNDMAQASLMVAWSYFWDEAVRFTLAYDFNQNEKVNSSATGSLAKWSKDIDNNQWTARMQVKF